MSQDGHVDGQHVVEQPREQQQGPHAPHVASVGSEGSRDSGKAVRFASSLANSLHGAAPAGGSSYGTSPPGMSERLGGSSASFDEAASVISSSVTYGARGMGTGPAAQPPPSGVGQHTDAEQQALAASSAASLAQALHQGTDPTLPVRVPVGRHGSLAAAAGMHQHEQQQQQQQQAGASTAAGAQLPAAASAMHAGQQQDEDDSVRPVCAFYKRTGTCAYGDRCKFIHPADCPPPKLNSRGYPLRPGEPDCPHYIKKGWCAFGATCKFNHQDTFAGISLTQLLAAAGHPGTPGPYPGRAGPAVPPYLALGAQQQLQVAPAGGAYHLGPSATAAAPGGLYYLSPGSAVTGAGVNLVMGPGGARGLPLAGMGGTGMPGSQIGGGHDAQHQRGAGGGGGSGYMGISQGAGDYGDFPLGGGGMAGFPSGPQSGGGGGGFAMQGGAGAYSQMGLPMTTVHTSARFLQGQGGPGSMGMSGAGFGGRAGGLDASGGGGGGMVGGGGGMGGGYGSRGGYPGGHRQGGGHMHMRAQAGSFDDSFGGSGLDGMVMGMQGSMGMGGLSMPGSTDGGMYEQGVGSVGVPDTMVSSQLASAMQRLRMREGNK